MFERLDPRTLLASITGTVFNDADSSTTFDTGEAASKSVTVYLDANANGRYDTGEATAVTNKSGRYTIKGVGAGEALLGVMPTAGTGETSPGPLGSVKGSFDITLTGTDDLTSVERRAFAQAAARWESIITGDLPNVGSVDDVTIAVTVDRIDGPGDTLAQAGPDDFRRGSDLPYTGDMKFDKADIQSLIDEGHFVDTITHEMAHVLGFGTIWDDLGLISGEGTRHPRFTGRAATAEYNRLFGFDGSSVPVENSGGDGTADGHWPESSFVEELMTGYDEGINDPEPLSRITVASMQDLGYTVNLKAADVWDPIDHTTTLTTPLNLGARAFERKIAVPEDGTVENVDFGLRADTAPAVGRVTAAVGTLGRPVTLSASALTDAEGDAIAGVSFYGETNGKPGLQGGRHGDTYLAAASARRGVYTATAPTTALAAGAQTYYAAATDALGLAGRRATTATLVAPPPPTRPNPVVATRQSKSSTLLQWRDRSDDEIGFRIEYSDTADYTHIIRAFNVATGTTSAVLEGLTHLTVYYARVRSYGYGGASAYTRLTGFRV